MAMLSDNEDKPYHAPGKADDYSLTNCTDEQLQKWASDPRCIEREQCAAFLDRRKALRAKAQEDRLQRIAAKRKTLEDDPFDPRTEVSADAKHIAGKIVTHLWILFVLLPIAAAILFAILK